MRVLYVFRSLFSWKQHIGRHDGDLGRVAQLVSILVLLEAAHRLDEADHLRLAQVVFRSLFSWKQHIGDADGRRVRHFLFAFRSLFSWKQHIGGFVVGRRGGAMGVMDDNYNSRPATRQIPDPQQRLAAASDN